MKLSESEKADLANNGIIENGGAYWVYKSYREAGVTHKEAVKLTVTGIQNMKSETLSKEQLEIIKRALFRIQGTMD